MKDRAYKTGGQWIGIFVRALGVGHREAVEMLRALEASGEMLVRRGGTWGLTYRLRPEDGRSAVQGAGQRAAG